MWCGELWRPDESYERYEVITMPTVKTRNTINTHQLLLTRIVKSSREPGQIPSRAATRGKYFAENVEEIVILANLE